jgi:muramoyltetrapeptide carboxypeptidase
VRLWISPKWIVGFSDITYLHAQLNCNIGVETLTCNYGTFSFATATTEAIESLKMRLFGNKLEYEFSSYSLNKNGHYAR